MDPLGKHLVLFLWFVLTIQLSGCEQQPSGGRRPAAQAGATQIEETDVSYEADIKPLLKKSCLSCHSGAQQPNLSSYASVKKAAKEVYASVRDGVMPQAKKNRWSARQVSLVKLWVAGGYLRNPITKKPIDESTGEDDEEELENNENIDEELDDEKLEDEKPDDEEPGDEKPKVTYDLNLKKIVKASCLSCHGAGGSLPELDTKKKVIAAGEAILDSIEDDRMPKTGPLKSSDKSIVKSWIAGGKL
jgi:mono/diheme cytochrome c family protein